MFLLFDQLVYTGQVRLRPGSEEAEIVHAGDQLEALIDTSGSIFCR